MSGTQCLAAFVLIACLTVPTIVSAQFAECGVLIDGITCPILFQTPNGNIYVLDNTGGFQPGDEVFVTGNFDPGCITICQQGAGCVFNNTIESPCAPPPPMDEFIRGDCDGDGTINALVDVLYLLAFGFQGGPPPPCDDASDVDDDGMQNPLVDGLYLLATGFIFGSPDPPPPYPDCGLDPTDDMLECAAPPCP